jgi:hypothetical protein
MTACYPTIRSLSLFRNIPGLNHAYCKDVLKTGEAYEAVEAQKRRNLGLFIALLLIGQ